MKGTTSNNFQWFCNWCKSKDEHIKAADQNKRIEVLEAKLGRLEGIEEKLDHLVNLLSNATTATKPIGPPPASTPATCQKSFSDITRTVIVKKPVGESPEANLGHTVDTLNDSRLQCVKTKLTASGDTLVVLPNSDVAEDFKLKMASATPTTTVKVLRLKKSTVSVVGVPNMEPAALREEILLKNTYLNAYINANTDELNILRVAPCRHQPAVYQATLSLSTTARGIIKKSNDRVLAGAVNCRVYDIIHNPSAPRRCSKCQMFGHWYKDCVSESRCGICSDGHDTRNCPEGGNVNVNKCINCDRAVDKGGSPIAGSKPHRAYSTKCPQYILEISKSGKLN